mgnify:FL=1
MVYPCVVLYTLIETPEFSARRASERIYLLTCYAKAEQEDISPNQRKMLRLVVEQLP